MIEKKAETSVEIHDVIARRWSIRAFDNSYRMTREEILALCEAARWAPSSMGDQPWNFVIFDKFFDADLWNKALDCLAAGNKVWALNSSILIAVFASQNLRAGGNNSHSDFDTGAACQNIYLQAVALGLASHPMGGFSADRITELAGAPEGFVPRAVIAVGKHAELDEFDERIIRFENAPRKRLPLAENFFGGSWGNAITNIK